MWQCLTHLLWMQTMWHRHVGQHLRLSREHLQVGDHHKSGHKGSQVREPLELLSPLLHISPVLFYKSRPQHPGIVQGPLLQILSPPSPLLIPASQLTGSRGQQGSVEGMDVSRAVCGLLQRV